MATHKTSNVMAVSLIAGLAGAGIALLLAPRSGRETRQKIHEKTDELKHQAGENVDKARLKMQHQAEKMKAWKEHMARKALEEGQEVTDKLKETMNEKEQADFDARMLPNWEEEV